MPDFTFKQDDTRYYLDKEGLDYFWQHIKSELDKKATSGEAGIVFIRGEDVDSIAALNALSAKAINGEVHNLTFSSTYGPKNIDVVWVKDEKKWDPLAGAIPLATSAEPGLESPADHNKIENIAAASATALYYCDYPSKVHPSRTNLDTYDNLQFVTFSTDKYGHVSADKVISNDYIPFSGNFYLSGDVTKTATTELNKLKNDWDLPTVGGTNYYITQVTQLSGTVSALSEQKLNVNPETTTINSSRLITSNTVWKAFSASKMLRLENDDIDEIINSVN